MKQETINKGHGLLKRIEDCQNAQLQLSGITNVELCNGNSRVRGMIRESGPSYLDSANASAESLEFMQSEFIRFRARLKKHFADLEYRFKEELEDLSDE